jgi:dolichol-phosphate mannosyltransferase
MDDHSVSIIIAVYNEAENVAAVSEEVLAAFGAAGRFELVFVDDGSSDATAERVLAIGQHDERVRLVRHAGRCGKSQAVRTGVLAARGPWIATMDGDGQNDPADLARMVAAARTANAGPPLIAGIRSRRHDPLARRLATRFANGLRSRVLGDGCPDTGCGMKVFRRDDFLQLPCFEGMHRFLPALFRRYGRPVVNHPVSHRARKAGASKYTNLGRALVGITDLFGVIWLLRRMTPVQQVGLGQIASGTAGNLRATAE